MIRRMAFAVLFVLLLGGLYLYAMTEGMATLLFLVKAVAILLVSSLFAFSVVSTLFGRRSAATFLKNSLVLFLTVLIMLPVLEMMTRYVFRDVTSTADNRSFFASHGYLQEVHLNSWGFRDREFKIPKPDQVYRIAVIGDSFTFGQGILSEERYSALLASRLDQGHARYEVINFGRCGAETVDHLEILQKNALHAEPDYVLLQWFVNDVEGHDKTGRPHYRPLLPSYFLRTKLRQSSAFYYVLNSQWGSLQTRLGLTPRYVDYMRQRFGDPNSADSREALAQLSQFIRTCQARQIPVGIVLFPDFNYDLGASYPFDYLHQRVAELCRAEQIEFLDLRATFARFADRQQLWANRLDAHPGPFANRVAADEIIRLFGRGWDL